MNHNKARFSNKPVFKKKKREGKMSKKCPHCGKEMVCKGPGDSAGATSWKCKNAKCGRRVWQWKVPVPPTPIVWEKK